MTATSAQFVSPKDRKIADLVRMAARLDLDALSFLVETARGIEQQRLQAEAQRLTRPHQPDPDPHGV